MRGGPRRDERRGGRGGDGAFRDAPSTPPIGRVAERAHQQRHVVALRGVAHIELDRDLGVERALAVGAEVLADLEGEPVVTGVKGAAGLEELLYPAIGVGLLLA